MAISTYAIEGQALCINYIALVIQIQFERKSTASFYDISPGSAQTRLDNDHALTALYASSWDSRNLFAQLHAGAKNYNSQNLETTSIRKSKISMDIFQ